VQTLFLAMALYPEVQKKAQAEIDAVVGPNRFPDFHDRPSLPYIDAIVKELTRWNLVAPLGRPFAIIHHWYCYHPDEFRRFSPHVYYGR
jgi:cytochrome P450